MLVWRQWMAMNAVRRTLNEQWRGHTSKNHWETVGWEGGFAFECYGGGLTVPAHDQQVASHAAHVPLTLNMSRVHASAHVRLGSMTMSGSLAAGV